MTRQSIHLQTFLPRRWMRGSSPRMTGPTTASIAPGATGRPAPYERLHLRRLKVSKPLIVSIPHRLGREEATRRIRSGLTAARTHYSALLTIHEESWSGDRLAFNLSALGQSAVGFIDVADDHVRLEVQLPWLLAVVAEKFTPAIRKEGTLMLEKK